MAKKIKKQPKRIDALVKARERYEDGNSCGDAIAKALEVFRTEDGLDIDGLFERQRLRSGEGGHGAPRRHWSLPHVRWLDAPSSRVESRLRSHQREKSFRAGREEARTESEDDSSGELKPTFGRKID